MAIWNNRMVLQGLNDLKERIAQNRNFLASSQHVASLRTMLLCKMCGYAARPRTPQESGPPLCDACDQLDRNSGLIRVLAYGLLSVDQLDNLIDFLLAPVDTKDKDVGGLELATISNSVVGMMNGSVFVVWPDGATWTTEIQRTAIYPPGYWGRV